MDVDILDAQEMFRKDIHYIIPEFQRRYIWCKDEQWDLFWEDVRNVAESYLDNRTRLNEYEAQTQTKPHFLGAVIIQQQSTPIKEIQKRNVIDGQQRLITLQLFLDALQWVCESYDHPHFVDVAKRLAKFVTNDKEIYKGKHIFKLWPSKFDQDAFEHVMDNESDAGDFKESRIAQAHDFFQQQVTKWLKDAPEEQITYRIDALEEAITTRFQIVVIDLDKQADPHIIFETLNARGTPLAQFELIKNFVMSKAQKPTDDMWGNLDDEWWTKEISQGRLYRPRLDMLFDYWLEMRKGADVLPPKVFDEFRKHAESQDIHNLMREIIKDFENYKEYEQTGGRTLKERSFYYHIDVMQAGVITPVLLLLLSNEAKIHTKAFDALESFLIRRMICRNTTKDYNRMVLELSNQLRQRGLNKSNVIVVDFLQKQTADTRKWPSDKDVENALMKLSLYRLLTRGRLRLVLEGVEQQLRAPKKIDDRELPKKLTIEHILPVGWKADNWPLSDEINEDERTELINTMGNLTLVNQPLNSSMSNASWESKRNALQDHSLLMLNKKLSSQQSWNDNDIKDRSREMSNLITKRWPGPESQEWNN